MGSRDFFMEGKAAGRVKLTTHLHPFHSKKEQSYDSTLHASS
jgi:hypothetical protein